MFLNCKPLIKGVFKGPISLRGKGQDDDHHERCN